MISSRYCATLYEGLKSCPKERHIHVVCDTDFIAHLIGRAEPELAGGRRERHARTIDIAQEEVYFFIIFPFTRDSLFSSIELLSLYCINSD